MHRSHRHGLALVVLVAGVALGGCGIETTTAGDTAARISSPAAQPPATSAPAAGDQSQPTVRLEYASGQVTGDERASVPLGSTVTLIVTSDTADELHVHGYDVSEPVTPGSPATLTFRADIPGVFEVELEQLGVQLTQLQVS